MRISIGNSRKDIHWKIRDWSWDQLCEKLSETIKTSETMTEYKSMTKDDKSRVKDIGGFVGGVVNNGRRTKANVLCRTLITLDADFATDSSWEDATMFVDNAMCCYSTHSHTEKAPRLRYVLPLDRQVTPEEYEPIARRIAADIGIDQFDVTTYETSRLMYWPSTPCDGGFIFERQHGKPVCADDVLARYHNWHDVTEWPIGSTEDKVRVKQSKAQGLPEEKPGIVGQFCRTYDIQSAISTFLPDVYEPCEGGRYTYLQGSTTAGAVMYGEGRFLYSHHSTDPAGGQLCNAFDLVRLHKFKDLDYEADFDTPINKLPSFMAMSKFASSDSDVKKLIIYEGKAKLDEAFPDDVEDEDKWVDNLQINRNGAVEPTANNILLILENDPKLKGCLAMNQFTSRLCVIKDLPWKKCTDKVNGTAWDDMDDSALRTYIETAYGISSQSKVADALNVVMQKHAFHPVRDYLNSLEWDGVQRGAQLFVDYMGAEESEYTLQVTKKWLTAAVARVMRPGCKFDNMIVLVGAQGIGKSYLGRMLGVHWYSDTFNTVSGKEAYEQLQGAWILEMGELSAMKRAEVESVKMFISKQEDNYRAAYGRHITNSKRQCVFYGTTNDDIFLIDRTGNRRFWPISCDPDMALNSVFSLTKDEVNQIWAEAVSWYKAGESLYLSVSVAKQAAEKQEEFVEFDPKQGKVEDYLELPLPENWETYDKTMRRNYVQGFLKLNPGEPTIERTSVSVVELAYELFGEENIAPWQAKIYHNILTGIPGWKKSGKRPKSVYGQQPVYSRVKE